MTQRVTRRTVLRFILISGAVAGCSPAATPVLPTAAATLPPGLPARFKLENDSISYAPHPRGCAQTTLRGSARTADGSPIPGLTIRVWEDDPAQFSTLTVDADGFYGADIAPDLTDHTFHLQLYDPSGTTSLSDVIVVAAIADCRFSFMTVNFIPAP